MLTVFIPIDEIPLAQISANEKGAVRSEEPVTASANAVVNFQRDIKPILAENCFSCHGMDADARAADLRLDKREAAVDGGAIDPGHPDDSSLIERIFETDEELVMPPPESHKTLTSEQKELLKRWITDGAEYQEHWSLIAPVRPEPPTVQDESWVTNEIDRFVLARLEREGLAPANEAGPQKLFRRLSLDISGLPPSPEDVDAFETDFATDEDQAVSVWIDRLMDRPSWGEHRARYWLDAARYADTHGMHFDNYREMWPYRDWVIRSFNANQPYDQFTIEQLAGDLLKNPTTDQLVATGFQRCNMTTNEAGTIGAENRALYAADRVQTFGWVYLGLTTNCCQCHDHKFDPLSIKDYYSLAAFFRNTDEPAMDKNLKDGNSSTVRVPNPKQAKQLEQLNKAIAASVKKRDQRAAAKLPEFKKWQKDVDAKSLAERLECDFEGLVLQVPLNEGTGNEVTATIGPDKPFQVAGEVQWLEDGKFGPAAVLGGKTAFDLGEVPEFDFDQRFSYGAWVKTPEKIRSGAIMARMDEGAKRRGWDLIQEGQKIAVHVIDSWPHNALKMITKKDVVKPNQWHHVFVTYDGTKRPEALKIYIDGESQPLQTGHKLIKKESSLKTKTPFRVGQRSKGFKYTGGSVQDVRIYDRQLTAIEVKAIGGEFLQPFLDVAAADRTSKQKKMLRQHYLLREDAAHRNYWHQADSLTHQRTQLYKTVPISLIQKEKKGPAMTKILMRGAYDKPGKKVVAAPPAALHDMPAGAPANRLGLAKWVVAPSNPLTARVTVNRFWQELFGQGIVATSEDFGVMGTPPSNQDLLDWLAVDFRESGWDVKRLFKKMLMSSAYRQSAVHTAAKIEKDRDNSLISRGPRFRMDAEMVRDYALTASGLFVDKMYGPGVKPYQPDDLWNVVGLPDSDTREYVRDEGEIIYRRSLYMFWKRMSPPPNLEAFDAPNRESCTVRRERTNTPLMALVTMNDPQFFEAARVLAQNALLAGNNDPSDTLAYIASRTVCRSLSEQEVGFVHEDFAEFLAFYESHPGEAALLISVGDAAAGENVVPARLAAWTMVCNQMLNLDEVLNK